MNYYDFLYKKNNEYDLNEYEDSSFFIESNLPQLPKPLNDLATELNNKPVIGPTAKFLSNTATNLSHLPDKGKEIGKSLYNTKESISNTFSDIGKYTGYGLIAGGAAIIAKYIYDKYNKGVCVKAQTTLEVRQCKEKAIDQVINNLNQRKIKCKDDKCRKEYDKMIENYNYKKDALKNEPLKPIMHE